jgi:undecaprenyl-diphosphatase
MLESPLVTYAQAIVLGVVQGVTEFLPISSSGHLILVPHLVGWPDQGLAFDAAMHLGTLAALLAYFRRELRAFLTGALSLKLALLILAASIPALALGWLLNRWVEENLRSPIVIAASTGFWAIVMWIADRSVLVAAPPGEPLERVGRDQAVAIGFAQALALIPGTSRSGITITTGLLAGLDRATAARFSFLLGIPVTAAAGAYKMLQILKSGLSAEAAGPLGAAVLAAFVSGWIAVWFLVGYLRRRSLTPFIIYRLILAAFLIALTL